MSAKKPTPTTQTPTRQTPDNAKEKEIKQMEKEIDDRYREAEKARDSGDSATFNKIKTELEPLQEKLYQKRGDKKNITGV
jgi:uncharacterized membrane protein (DUF106 family)